MPVSEKAVRRLGYALCVLAVVILAFGIAAVLASSAAGDRTLANVLSVATILAAGFPLAYGIVCVTAHEQIALNRLTKAAGLDRQEQALAYFRFGDAREFCDIVPESHRRHNPEMAAALIRVTVRWSRSGDGKLFTRIASTLLTPTDAVQLFGPLLDDFARAFAQSVENIDDRHADELLDLVRTGSSSPEEVIAYLCLLQSVTAAVRMLRDRIPLDYAGVLL